MVINPDDIASLKVGVHKLAIAIEELALKKYAQGEIDLSKLPWFTSHYVPGDSIKLSSSRLPTMHLENNFTLVQTESIVKANGATFAAHKVLEEMPLPDFLKAMTQNAKNEENDSNGSDVSATVESEKDVQLSAQKVSEEMPLPDFMKEIAQNAKNEGNDSNGSDLKLVLDTGCEDPDEFLKYECLALAGLGSSILQEVKQLVEERMKTNEKALKTTFGAAELKVDGYLCFLDDAAVTAFQYDNLDKLCSSLVEAKKVVQDMMSAYASYVKNYYLGSFETLQKWKELSLLLECDVHNRNFVFDLGGLHIATTKVKMLLKW